MPSYFKKLLKILFFLLLSIVCIYYFFIRTLITSPIGDSTFEKSFNINAEDLKKHVSFLTHLLPARNVEHPESLNAAADYITKEWNSLGFQVEEQKYLVHGKEYKNLIIKIGADSTHITVIGAHYDVCGEQSGADDNASGVSGLIELARLLSQNKGPIKNQIQLVAYTLEEPPTYASEKMGSFIHAKSLAEKNVAVDLMISLEMIGYFSGDANTQSFPIELLKLHYPTTGNFIALVSNIENRDLVKIVKSSLSHYSKVPIFSINGPNFIPGIDFSDHRSYWKFGYKNAMMITDTSFYRNHNYHKTTDTEDTLDYTKMAQVISGVYGMLYEINGAQP